MGTAYVPPPAHGSCRSGKVQFATRKQARQGRRTIADSSLTIYRCGECDWFHLGHLPQRVRNGEVDKAVWDEVRSR